MKKSINLSFTGRYWKEDDLWIARSESLDLEARAGSPYQCLLKLMESFAEEPDHENFNCSISVIDSGIFFLLLRKTNETPD